MHSVWDHTVHVTFQSSMLMKDHIDTTYVVNKCDFFFFTTQKYNCVKNIFVTFWWVFQLCSLSICCSNPYNLNTKWDSVSFFNLPSVLRTHTRQNMAMMACCFISLSVSGGTYSHMICHMVWIWINREYLLIFPFIQEAHSVSTTSYCSNIQCILSRKLLSPFFFIIINSNFYADAKTFFHSTPCILKKMLYTLT